jgi:hypothetical protein
MCDLRRRAIGFDGLLRTFEMPPERRSCLAPADAALLAYDYRALAPVANAHGPYASVGAPSCFQSQTYQA